MKKSVAIFMALTLILNLSFFAAAETVESADASTMRLARAEGCVFLKEESAWSVWYGGYYLCLRYAPFHGSR